MTSVGNDGFPSVLEALKNNGEREIRVIGVDARADATGIHTSDKGYTVPPRKDPASLVQNLQEIIKTEHIDVLLPLSTEDQPFFAEIKREFPVPVVVNSPETLAVANDKFALLNACVQIGVPTPKFVGLSRFEEIEEGFKALGFPEEPVMFKTNLGTGAQGVKIIDPTLDAHTRFFDRDNMRVKVEDVVSALNSIPDFPPSHLAEYLPGKEFSADVLAWDGTILGLCIRERLASLYGLATHSKVVENAQIEAACARIVKHLDLKFVTNIQFKMNKSNEPAIMEINPRIPGTIGHTVMAGINMPYEAIKLALGENVTAKSARVGSEVLRTWKLVEIA